MDIARRVNQVRAHMEKEGIGLCVVTNDLNQFYLSGYKAIIYSRPILLAISMQEARLIVPGLEEDHAKAHYDPNFVDVYYEHPEKVDRGGSHLFFLKKMLDACPKGSKVGAEYASMSIGLEQFIREQGYEISDISPLIRRMRYIKDEEEKQLMRQAGKLVSEAMRISVEKAKPGVTEMEMDQFGNQYLLEETPKRHPGATLDIFVMSPGGLARTNMPHVFSSTRKYNEKEIVLHSRQVGLSGYRAEIERTFFLGKPSDRQMDIYKVMTEAQQAMLAAIKPGMTAGEADAIGRTIIQKAGLGQYSNHRCGHGIGVGLHEEPYLRYDNDLVLEENMAFSIEPGIYIPELGGFRHSDTVILTKDGSEKITEHAWKLEDLIFE